MDPQLKIQFDLLCHRLRHLTTRYPSLRRQLLLNAPVNMPVLDAIQGIDSMIQAIEGELTSFSERQA